MTDTQINLQAFCSTDESRSNLLNPVAFEGYVYASSGAMAIRVSGNGQPDSECVSMARPLRKYFEREVRDWAALPHEPSYLIRCSGCLGTGEIMNKETCPCCDGEGDVECESCGSCTKTCDLCGGGGSVDGKREPCTKCGGAGNNAFYILQDRHVASRLVDLMRTLPNVQVGSANDIPIPFRFDGGEGVVMPHARDPRI